ncbi:MAG: class I SAM-dependent methyltransferase [Saprospiraceae bacterium]|nr:class I SAM-dependent methyltransferase [Saprospiraceae bacterium]
MKPDSPIKYVLLALVFMAMQVPATQAQSVDTIQMAVIRGLSVYRTELMKRNLEDLGYLIKLMEIMRANIPDEELYWDFLNEMRELSTKDSVSIVREVKKLTDKYPYTSFLKAFTYDDYRAISRSHEMFFMFGRDLMVLEYPFKLSNPGVLTREFEFYQIRQGHKIGEVGAGNGMTSLLLGVIYDSLSIYVNEINPKMITQIESVFSSCQSLRPGVVFHPVLGQNYTTGLEGMQLDLIIARHSFHHFTRVKDMLISIRKSLAPNGLIILEEPDATLRKQDPWMCYLAQKKNKIVKTWEKYGFRLIEEKRDETAVLLKFALD